MKISKLLFAFMTLSLFLTFSACSNEIDDNLESGSIVGTWTFSEAVADVIESNNPEYNSKIGEYVVEKGRKDYDMTIIFTADGKITSSYGDDDERGTHTSTYTFEDGIMTVITDEGYSSSIPVSVDGNKLYLYDDYEAEFNFSNSGGYVEGISDTSVRAEKAIVKITFTR